MKVLISICLLLSMFSFAGDASERIIKNIEFARVDKQRLALDLYLPEGVKDPPLVIWIHGGGWKSGSREQCQIRWMTDHGFAIASISYRLTDQAIFPAQIHDCKAAVRWLRANSETYGYSAEKLAVAGASAGGMLAALLGTSGGVSSLEGTVGGNLDQSSRVQAVIDFYGATDFVLRSKTQPSRANEPGSVVHRLLGGGADDKLALAKMASAAFHVSPDDPPMLVYHGEKDKTVLPDQSKRIHDVYSAAGLPITLITIQKAGHGGKQFHRADNRRTMINFLKRHISPQEDI
jgi:acetyl esterase/lipase